MSKSLKSYQCHELQTHKDSLPRALGFIKQGAASSGNILVSGKSAVERLEESKANYVKTESVLDCKQQLFHSSHLKVTTRPSIEAFLKTSVKDLRKEPGRKDSSYLNRKGSSEELLSPSDAHINTSLAFTPSPTNANPSHDAALPSAQSIPKSSAGNIGCLPHGAKGPEQSFKKRRFKRENSLVKNAIQCFESGFQGARQDGQEWNGVNIEWQEAPGENAFMLKHSESEGHSSGASDSKHSSSAGDITELINQCPGSKTSDYVSRSSSFKCAYNSDRVRSLISTFEAKLNENIEYKKNKDVSLSVGRSKSDVSHRFPKATESTKNTLTSNNNEELESFFNNMGLDPNIWDHLTPRPESPTQFFDSVSSLNSGDHRSSTDSDESEEGVREGLTNADLRRHGPTETSIIEKNARVVKWLYSCRKSVT